jgi:hypothetical protein
MEIALISTKLKTKTIIKYSTTANSNKKQRNRNRRKSQQEEIKIKNRNSPHNNWSLHNHPPREIRNIIPELPTQNVPAPPQNSSPLARQHRGHSYNKISRSQIQTQNTKLKIKNSI